jgi:predicted cupin superfamily sugar epimerase
MGADTFSADEIRRRLALAPHPEGGWYRETFRDAPAGKSGRSASTAIYFLLEAGELSRWHRVDAAEVWHYYAGASLELAISPSEDRPPVSHSLGTRLDLGEAPQMVVPAGSWQQARSLGAWTLVGCTVAPGFIFDGFEMAPPGFVPGGARGP